MLTWRQEGDRIVAVCGALDVGAVFPVQRKWRLWINAGGYPLEMTERGGIDKAKAELAKHFQALLDRAMLGPAAPQPMATAPRDGTIVDLWLPGGGRMTDQWWEESDQTWTGLGRDSMFSGWSPIPGYRQKAATDAA